MSTILLPTLYGLAGVCAYAGVHHGLIAWRRPVERTHLVFAVLCLAVLCYVLAKTGAYRAESPRELVASRRFEISAGIVAFSLLPWFVAAYTGMRPIWPAAGLCAFMVSMLFANLALPYGLGFVEPPALERLTLPWGEELIYLGVSKRSAWHHAGWIGILAIFVYGFVAGAYQYRSGARRRALILLVGMGLFFAFTVFNQVVNFGLVRFTPTAELGFLWLVVVMNQGLIQELRKRERQVRAVLDNVPAVIDLKDMEGRYLFVNRHFEGLFQVDNATVAGKTDHFLFPKAQADALRANDRKALQSRAVLSVQESAEMHGELRVYSALKFPLLHPDGTPYGTGGVSTDITDRRKAEEEMRRLRWMPAAWRWPTGSRSSRWC